MQFVSKAIARLADELSKFYSSERLAHEMWGVEPNSQSRGPARLRFNYRFPKPDLIAQEDLDEIDIGSALRTAYAAARSVERNPETPHLMEALVDLHAEATNPVALQAINIAYGRYKTRASRENKQAQDDAKIVDAAQALLDSGEMDPSRINSVLAERFDTAVRNIRNARNRAAKRGNDGP